MTVQFRRFNCTVPMRSEKSSNAIVVSALSVRTGFGKLLRRVED